MAHQATRGSCCTCPRVSACLRAGLGFSSLWVHLSNGPLCFHVFICLSCFTWLFIIIICMYRMRWAMDHLTAETYLPEFCTRCVCVCVWESLMLSHFSPLFLSLSFSPPPISLFSSFLSSSYLCFSHPSLFSPLSSPKVANPVTAMASASGQRPVNTFSVPASLCRLTPEVANRHCTCWKTSSWARAGSNGRHASSDAKLSTCQRQKSV